MSRADHSAYKSTVKPTDKLTVKNSRRDDAATLPLAGESTTGRAPAARTAATAGAHQRHPDGWLWVVIGLCAIGFGVVSCHHDEDAAPFCAEVACDATP